MRVAFLLMGLWSAAAHAQIPIAPFELERLRLNPGAAHGLVLDSADLLPRFKFRAALTVQYEHAPLVLLSQERVASRLVAARWTTHVSGAFAATDWLELGAQLPVVLAQPGDAQPPFAVARVDPGPSFATSFLHARAAFLQERRGSPLDMSAGVAVGFPLGRSEALTTENAVTAVPTVATGKGLNRWLRAGASASVVLRPTHDLSPLEATAAHRVGSFFSLGAGLNTLGDGLKGELSGRFDAPFTPSALSGEVLAGARYPLMSLFEVYVLAGLGFGAQPGTPTFRLLAGVALAPRNVPPPPGSRCVRGQPHVVEECPELDFDGDGFRNATDRCPKDMGVRALDGCPENDSDADGLLDSADACPAQPGDAALQGCRPPDADADGMPDARDACPDQPAKKSLRGCPDVDGDGLDALDDACPQVAGVVELKGCADMDSDGDGIVDRLDACRSSKGQRNNQGCPAEEKLLVIMTRERLVIRDKVYFATAKSEVLPQSFVLLRQIARILGEHPEVPRVSIEGHTDDRGAHASNLALSRARAEAVRRFLQSAGVAAGRMSAAGFGSDRPIESNQTAQGREANRRVDFLIVAKEHETEQVVPANER
jgi:OmpA-OmpF porin, OOP family